MRFGPVGIRCPECAGHRAAAGTRKRLTPQLKPPNVRVKLPVGSVTAGLIAVNAAVYLGELATGGGISDLKGEVELKGALYGPWVAQGDWWRLFTAAFLHASPIHILFNMLFLWWFGRSLEHVLGPARFIGIYLVSALAGSAGALLVNPTGVTVGASGAVFGILGAGLVLERGHNILVFGGQALAVIAINLVLSFVLSGISIGGHVGGLVGGAAAMLVLSHFGRYKGLLSRDGIVAIACLAGLAALSVIIAYAKVRNLA
jgi:membrane associated rhomboid family serine protease